MCSTEIVIWPEGEWCYLDDMEKHPLATATDYEIVDVGVASDTQIQDFVERYLVC